MLKSTILLFNLIGVIIFELFYGEVVTIKQDPPRTMQVNVADTVKITISKGALDGFAKLQQDIPNGFTAEILESQGGTFSFKNNTLKVIWIALPVQETFEIKYLLTASESAKTDNFMTGKFSYIEENERINIDFGPTPINVVSSGTLVMKETKKTPNAKKICNEDNMVASSEDFKVFRTIKAVKGDGDKYKVDLVIEKVDINSFGKIEENIPSGFEAAEGFSQEGLFSFKKNQVKILWMAMPDVKTVSTSYFVTKTDAKADTLIIDGKFSYLKNENTFSEGLAYSGINMEENNENALADNTTTGNNSNSEETKEDKIEEIETIDLPEDPEIIEEETIEEIKNNTIVQKEEPKENTNSNSFTNNSKKDNSTIVELPKETTTTTNTNNLVDNNTVKTEVKETKKEENIIANNSTTKETDEDLMKEITKVPSPETGISYKVQIAAGHKEIPTDYFRTVHSINESVATEYHNGWRKYTVGKFPIYKEARDKRNQVWAANNKISDAFVTAYNQGNRISVQEALMISKQDWFK